jgi:hypothetical protein
MGLIMLVLVGIVPISFAVNLNTSQAAIADLTTATEAPSRSTWTDRHSPGVAMAGRHVASDELSAYLKTNGQVNERTFAAMPQPVDNDSTWLVRRCSARVPSR